MSDKERKDQIINRLINRRNFIKSGLVAASAGAVTVGASGCGRDQVYKADYPVVSENKVHLKPNGKSVLILGGGFGGMHAACELVDRGFKVTIIEQSAMLGGKLKSWRDKTFGVPPGNDPNWKGYPRDHGAHAVWGFYNNLREFMGRHDYKMWKFPRESTIYNFLDKDGTNSIMGNPPTWPWPFDKLDMLLEARGQFKFLSDKDREMMMSGMIKIGAFDYDNEKERKYLDNISFPEYARSIGLPESMIYKFFASVSEMAMFDHIDNTSALYILMTGALGSGHYDDMNVDLFAHPPGETYAAPLEKYIKNKGGEIVFNTPVVKINWEGDKIKSVTAGDIMGGQMPPGVKRWQCSVCGSISASPIRPDRCPVCSAQADMLRAYSPGPATEYTADYYVLAMDTKNAKDVILRSKLADEPYFDKIMKLESTNVYPVNIWYSNCNSWKKRFPNHMDFFPSSFRFLGITLDWAFDGVINGKKVAEQLVPDYANKNICVIESQIANTEKVEALDDEQIMRLVHEELKIVMPDLPNPTDFYVNRWDTYSPQRVGYEALRPEIQSPIDNLFIIGDWVKADHLSVYMERTNVTARMVTNLLLDKIGQKKGKVKVLKSGTPSVALGLLRWLFNVYP